MQTQPRPPADPIEVEPATPANKKSFANSLRSVPRPALLKLLNVALAFVGVGLAFLFVSRGWSGYERLPGGRKMVFGLGLLVAGGLVVGRVGLGLGRAGLISLAAHTWRNHRVREAVPVAGLVGIALVVRLWGINFGLPYLEHVDEWNVAERASHIVQTGSFDPHDYRHPGLADNDRQAFTYPTLYTYMQAGVFALRFLQGVSAGQYDGTLILSERFTKGDFYLWGRALTALVGAATVGLLYVLGRKFYGHATGLVAALFLTFFYLHALNSHWITTDVPSSFMVLLPFLWIWPILQGKADRKTYLLAGLFCGLAVATKYNNAVILLPLALAHGLSRPPLRWPDWNLFLAFGTAVTGFFMGAPFILWHVPQFLTDLAAIANHYQNIGHPGYESSQNWREYLDFMLLENAPVVWLGLAGMLLAAVRHHQRDLLLLAFPLVSYLQLASYKVHFSRNLMPFIPFLCLFAALFLVLAVRWLSNLAQTRRLASTFSIQNPPTGQPYGPKSPAPEGVKIQNLAIGIVALLVILSPAQAIFRYDAYNALPTNRARATAWIEQNLPRGAKLWLEPLSTDLLPRTQYRLEGGKGVLANPPEWYAANGFHYVVLSEAHHKQAAESGSPAVRDSYRAYLEGPYPAGMTPVQDFKKNPTDRPGARILVLSTGLPLLLTPEEVKKAAQPLDFNFDNRIRLVGTGLPTIAKPGANITVSLYWQTTRPTEGDYTTFLHLLNAEGKIVTQLDLPPFAGTRPTSSWRLGETLRDDYPLALPANLPPGTYRLAVGLYRPNGPRLPLPGGETQAVTGSIEVK